MFQHFSPQPHSWSLMRSTFRHDRQDRGACNNGMHAGMSLSYKLRCVGQSEEKFPRQQRTDRGIARFKHINKDGLQMDMSSDFILCNICLLCQQLRGFKCKEDSSSYEQLIPGGVENEFKYRVHNDTFTNKATPKPVTIQYFINSPKRFFRTNLRQNTSNHNTRLT